jgi:hypothetical protein
LTRASGIQSTSAATQTVVPSSGAKLNLNDVTYITGKGTADNSALIQDAVNACPTGQKAECRINLIHTVIAATVYLPSNSNIIFTATGKVDCTVESGVACFKRITTTAILVTTQISFYGITFTASNGGIVIWDTLFFMSNGNAGETISGCTFILSNHSIGLRVNGTQRSFITNNFFGAASSTDMSGIAIQPQGTASRAVNSAMYYTVTGNIFSYLTAFNPQAIDPTTGDCWEGWQITGNFFRLGTINIFRGDAINLVGNQITGSNTTIDSSFNEIVSDNYFDTNRPGENLLTIKNTASNTTSVNIENNHFDANGSPDTSMVVFANGGTGFLTQQIVLTGNTYTGGSNAAAHPIYGVVFSDAALRNVYLANENFNFLYSCLHFAATLSRSTIGQFEANSPVYYADGFVRFAGRYVIADHLWKQFHVHMTGRVIPAKTTQDIASEMLYYPTMFPGEIVTVSQVAGEACSPGASIISSVSLTGAHYVVLRASSTAAAGLADCDATVTVDGTTYIGPR